MEADVTPEQWVAELESGDWIPVTGQLVGLAPTEDWLAEDEYGGHCCLGVLARMAGYTDKELSDGGEGEWVDAWVSTSYPTNLMDQAEHDWKTAEPRILPPVWLTADLARKFARLNDDYGVYPIDAIKEAFGIS